MENSQYLRTGDMGQSNVSVTKTKIGKQVDERIKNLRGDLGPICNYCAGLGFTNSLGGGALGCNKCSQTGVEPIDSYELQDQINELKESIGELKTLIVKLGKK